MLNKLKSEKGITGVDVSISIIIIMLFLSIIIAASMNVSTSLASKRRLEIATNCMTEIIEKVDEMDYDNVEIISDPVSINNNETYADNTLKKEVQTILKDEEKNYDILKVELKVENHYPQGETDKVDIVKKVTVKIIYELNNKEEFLEVTRVKPRYNVNLEDNE